MSQWLLRPLTKTNLMGARARLFDVFLSERTKKGSERVIITIAILSFLVHLAAIFAAKYGLIEAPADTELLSNPIAAIYTPFSFILIYEAYLLVYYLPKSTTIYIGKQYEIITLILIRRIFKDLANLEFTENWFAVQEDLQFSMDLGATILLFGLIYLFNRLNEQRLKKVKSTERTEETETFIRRKRWVSFILVPFLLGLAIYSFVDWMVVYTQNETGTSNTILDINKVFFDSFFGVLIMTDVLLLLFSLFHTDQFSGVIRNSGFVISTILIKLSFGTEGLLSTVLIVLAVLFGVVVLWLYNQYLKLENEV
jgi:hypothetical protein